MWTGGPSEAQSLCLFYAGLGAQTLDGGAEKVEGMCPWAWASPACTMLTVQVGGFLILLHAGPVALGKMCRWTLKNVKKSLHV